MNIGFHCYILPQDMKVNRTIPVQTCDLRSLGRRWKVKNHSQVVM